MSLRIAMLGYGHIALREIVKLVGIGMASLVV